MESGLIKDVQYNVSMKENAGDIPCHHLALKATREHWSASWLMQGLTTCS
jgi:hypothetical protein